MRTASSDSGAIRRIGMKEPARVGRYFPRRTIDIEAIEPPGFRRLTLSLPEMAVITGIILRLLRAVALTYGPSASWLYLGGVLALGVSILFGMAALHLANFTLRHWIWRAPAFAAIEAATEIAISALLITVGREPMGTEFAHWQDLDYLALLTISSRLIAVLLFAAALAGTIQIVRQVMLARSHSTREAATLRAELYSEAPESEIDSAHDAGSARH